MMSLGLRNTYFLKSLSSEILKRLRMYVYMYVKKGEKESSVVYVIIIPETNHQYISLHYYYFTPHEFLTKSLISSFLMQSGWRQVSLGHQDGSKYSSGP